RAAAATAATTGSRGGGGWQRWQQKAAPYLFLSPFLILFCVFSIYPIVKSVSLSLYATSGPKDMVPVGLGNYAYLVGDPDFHKAVWNTGVFAFWSIFLQLPLALGLAILLTQKWVVGRNVFRWAIFSPNLMGQVFVGVLFARIFMPQYGILNRFLEWATSGRIPADTKWLNNPDLVMPALVITSLWLYVGFNMIYFLAALQAVDTELYEAARVDGANPWQQFLHVTVPGIKPVMVFVLVTATIGSFQLFELPFTLLGGGGPDNRGLTIVMYLYQNGFSAGDLGFASAVGWTLALGILAISLVQMRLTGGFKAAGE
ncbi:MAG TPA: sugar ABC transporter permease, partial [Armatimonadaceae bacterium]|nr:sugar ABC transporter permease [Armatimonadaceae bacterium]